MFSNSKFPQTDAIGSMIHNQSHENFTTETASQSEEDFIASYEFETTDLHAKITELETRIADLNTFTEQLIRTPIANTRPQDTKEYLIDDLEIFKDDTEKNREAFLNFTAHVELKMTGDK
jgi:hypothetical protein